MDDIEVYMDSANTGSSYLESLVKCREHINPNRLERLDTLIDLELDLAILGAEKAKSEILKSQARDNLRPIK